MQGLTKQKQVISPCPLLQADLVSTYVCETCFCIQHCLHSERPHARERVALARLPAQLGPWRRCTSHDNNRKTALASSDGYGQPGMASQKHSKKEGSFKDLFTKTPAKKKSQPGAPEGESGDAAGPGLSESDGAPLTRAFMEQLFRSLWEDFATPKQEIAADIKYLKSEVINLGQRMDTIEKRHNAREEEMDCHRRELITFQDKNQDLQF
ncbi:hypothetical protein NDU88_000537 [Pleurodeles waltl]|uniref:Uncharacterized protein n=1 Tax=Pleurodeles waltl TaxID=8319 RepID=A0AAV7KNL8_PLEWA|nr:hypothetical protein NDU88_000537 [Pleurodeles waltl]